MTFETALSGLNSASKALDVTGDNISNSSTVGFKVAQAHFADIFAATVAGAAASTVGLGAGADNVIQSFKQGDISATDNPLDMAIGGRGFFRMNDNGTTTYTRNGQFHSLGQLDATGKTYTQAQLTAQKLYVVNDSGLHLTGYNADYGSDPTGTINATGKPTDILLDQSMPAVATTTASMNVNLDARSSLVAGPFDPSNSSTYNTESSIKAYDATGKRYDLTVYFSNTASDTWDVNATVKPDVSALSYPLVVTAGASDQFTLQMNGGPAQTVTIPASAVGYTDVNALKKAIQSAVDSALGAGQATVSLVGNHLEVASATSGGSAVLGEGNGGLATYFGDMQPVGTLTFDAFGNLNPLTQTFPITFQSGVTSVQLDLTGSTQFANSFTVNSAIQNGYGNGQLTAVSVGGDGIIAGNYSNGRMRKLAQVVLANFANTAGLINRGENQWIASDAAGKEQLDTPANANKSTSLGLGAITGSAVEAANIDLGAEMINLITQQRFYQANAQAIKTQDQVLQTLSNIR